LPVAAEVVAVSTTTLSGAAAAVTPRRRGGGLLAGLAVATVVMAIVGATAVTLAGPSSEAVAPAPRMSDALVAFLRWSTTHPGAACPTGAELGFERFAVTCTDQPADQI